MIDYIFLGILQGMFEWLPISSEGVVAITGKLLEMELNLIDIALFLHFGTIFAVLVYFRKDWFEVLTLKDKKTFNFLVITTIISLLVGFPLYVLIRESVIGSGLLLLVGLGLILTSYLQKLNKEMALNEKKTAVVSGFLQGLAVIPGLSRSGSTIFGLSLGKKDPKEVLKLSYMMSVPVVLASTFYIALKNPLIIEGWPALIVSFFVGFLTLGALMKFAQRINFSKFTFIFGLICIFGFLIGLLI